MNVQCTNKSCEIDKCQHHGGEHEWTRACHGGCFEKGECLRTFSEAPIMDESVGIGVENV